MQCWQNDTQNKDPGLEFASWITLLSTTTSKYAPKAEVVHGSQTYLSAANVFGLLLLDTHFDASPTDATAWKTDQQHRERFAPMLVHSLPACPLGLWEDYINDLTDNCEYQLALVSPPLRPSSKQLYNYSLLLLKSSVLLMGKTLKDVGLLDMDVQLLFEFRGGTVNEEDTILPMTESIVSPEGALFFFGPGSSGKPYLLNTCLRYCNRNNLPFFTVASSGIAALLLLDGGTAHLVVKIPAKDVKSATVPQWFQPTNPGHGVGTPKS
ncbi:hypothetical protein DFH28DRAFT_933968 [Melampsora americana]|nr:hypothetical protein DFH28DRAFT_933968 [Melampsora americana]